MELKRLAALAISGLLFAAGIGLVVLALDVRRWQSAVESELARFHAAAEPETEVTAAETAPFHSARRLLGVDDDLAYRHALRIFRLAMPRSHFSGSRPDLGGLRGQAQAELTSVAFVEPDRRRRARAVNLLGVLALLEAGERPPQLRGSALEKAVDRFRIALRLDPSDGDAKFNLEVTMRQLQSDAEQGGAASSSRGGGQAPGAGLAGPGRGY